MGAVRLDTTRLDAAWRPRHNAWLIAAVATLAPFMEILDSTIVNVCLPNIAGSLSASYDDAAWTLTSYLIANGIVLPVSGWLGRLIGRKRYFLACIALFTVCSFLCGIATTLPQLVVFRLLQGLFGAGLQPNQQAVILDTFEPAQRGRGFSVVAISVIFAPILGPLLGGWITDTYSWRWVFLINVPVGIVAFLAVLRLVEDPPWVRRDRTSASDIDYVGLGLIALGLGCLQLTLDRGEDWGWFGSPLIRLFALLSATGIAGAIAWLLLTDKPVVNLRALGDRNFAVGVVSISCIGMILYSSNLIIPEFAQQWMGYTAWLAGLLISPGALMTLLLIPFVARLVLPNFQTRHVLAFGFLVLGCASLYAYRLTPTLDFRTMALWRAVQATGLAFLFVPNRYYLLFHHAAFAERRRDRAVRDVPQHRGLGRHRGRGRDRERAVAGPPGLSGRAFDPVRSELCRDFGAVRAYLARHGSHGGGRAAGGDGAAQSDADPTGRGAGLCRSVRAVRRLRVLRYPADVPVPRQQGRRAQALSSEGPQKTSVLSPIMRWRRRRL